MLLPVLLAPVLAIEPGAVRTDTLATVLTPETGKRILAFANGGEQTPSQGVNSLKISSLHFFSVANFHA